MEQHLIFNKFTKMDFFLQAEFFATIQMLEQRFKHQTLALLTCTGVQYDPGPVHYQCPQWCNQFHTGIPEPEDLTLEPSSFLSYEEMLP